MMEKCEVWWVVVCERECVWQEAMRACQHCFVKHASVAEELAKVMYYHSMQLMEGKHLMDVVYLVNDTVLKG